MPPPPAATPKRRRPFPLLVSALVGTLLLLEVVLQLGSLVVYWLQPRPSAVTVTGSQTILCVGDSWTHGMGSSDTGTRSYPAVVQELLRARTNQPWTVVNCGQAGQNSRDVLERLPGQLKDYQPNTVLVLVGQNDFWSKPVPVSDSDNSADVDHRGYRFRWRLPRLWAWVAGKLTGAGQAGVPTASAAGARVGPEWQPRVVKAENPYATKERAPWTWVPEAQALKAEGWRLDAAKDYPGALACVRKALALSADDGQCHQLMATLLRRMGREAEAKQHLDWLRTAHLQSQSYWTGSALAWALNACGLAQEMLDLLQPLLTRFPEDGSLWRLRGETELYLGMVDDAERSLARAIALAPDKWSYISAFRTQFLGRRDPTAAARVMFDGYVVLNDAALVEETMLSMDSLDAGQKARAAVDSYECAPDVRTRLVQILDDVLRHLDGAEAGKVLATHLGRVIATIRAAGAQPVLLGYPGSNRAGSYLRQAAAAHGAAFLDVHQQFDERRGPRPLMDLRAPDGHCNDDGYRLMAEIVADGLLPILGGTGKRTGG
ncbi:MAG: GDSL-type esterase/lipase family protein [Planctomycetota bacterium]